jgi:hypothetical protein
MANTPPLYAEAAKHAPAHIQRWQNDEWPSLSPSLRKTAARLLGVLLVAILAYALSGCATCQPTAFNHSAETAAPTAATH